MIVLSEVRMMRQHVNNTGQSILWQNGLRTYYKLKKKKRSWKITIMGIDSLDHVL